MSDNPTKDRVLRLTLKGNAWFSVALGAGLFLAARPVADVVGLTSTLGVAAALALVFGTGVALAIAGAGLYSMSHRPIIDRWLAGVATGANALWVVGTVLLLAIAGPAIPAVGRWLLGSVAEIFAAFAAVEAYGMWLARPIEPTPPRQTHVRWHGGTA